MNRGIILKTARDALPLLVVLTLAIVVLETVFVIVIADFWDDLDTLLVLR